MRELGAYVGIFYATLNAVSLISIFVFDHYDLKFGGQWANAGLGAMLTVPLVVVAGVAYAFSAYLRDRGRSMPRPPYLSAASGAVVSLALACTTFMLDGVFPRGDAGLVVLSGYFFVVGALAPWVYHLSRKVLARAA